VDNQFVVHIETGDMKIIVETPNSLTTLKLIPGQGSWIYLNGSDIDHYIGESGITKTERSEEIERSLVLNSQNSQSTGATILETLVTDIIFQLGVPANIKGYSYLREAIILAVNNPTIIGAMTKELYPAVANIFHTTTLRVERAIRHAITVAWQRVDSSIMKEYFGNRMYLSMIKPSNSEFIATISDRISLRMNKP
jgi:hypothetical protein